MMITTTTTTTTTTTIITTASQIADMGIVVVITLIILLSLREILGANEKCVLSKAFVSNSYPIIVPLLCAFISMVIYSTLKVL